LLKEKKKVKALNLEVSKLKAEYEKRIIDLESENGKLHLLVKESNSKVEVSKVLL
jgi:hypothetical protein